MRGATAATPPVVRKADWVQCDNIACRKWRALPPSVDISQMPDKWFCNNNIWDKDRNTCQAKEESEPDALDRLFGPIIGRARPGRKPGRKPLNDENRKRGRSASKRADGTPLPKSQKAQPGAVEAQVIPRSEDWVQCDRDSCKKWRKVFPPVDVDSLPAVWYCELNTWDPEHDSCAAPQEETRPPPPAQAAVEPALTIAPSKPTGSAARQTYRDMIFYQSGKSRVSRMSRNAAYREITARLRRSSAFIPSSKTTTSASTNSVDTPSAPPASSLASPRPASELDPRLLKTCSQLCPRFAATMHPVRLPINTCQFASPFAHPVIPGVSNASTMASSDTAATPATSASTSASMPSQPAPKSGATTVKTTGAPSPAAQLPMGVVPMIPILGVTAGGYNLNLHPHNPAGIAPGSRYPAHSPVQVIPRPSDVAPLSANPTPGSTTRSTAPGVTTSITPSQSPRLAAPTVPGSGECTTSTHPRVVITPAVLAAVADSIRTTMRRENRPMTQPEILRGATSAPDPSANLASIPTSTGIPSSMPAVSSSTAPSSSTAEPGLPAPLRGVDASVVALVLEVLRAQGDVQVHHPESCDADQRHTVTPLRFVLRTMPEVTGPDRTVFSAARIGGLHPKLRKPWKLRPETVL